MVRASCPESWLCPSYLRHWDRVAHIWFCKCTIWVSNAHWASKHAHTRNKMWQTKSNQVILGEEWLIYSSTPESHPQTMSKKNSRPAAAGGESASLIEAITCENHHVFHIDIGSILVTNPSLCAGSAHCFHEEEKTHVHKLSEICAS